MADRFIGLNRGDTKNDTVEGAASTATLDVEIRMDLDLGMERHEVLVMIDMLRQHIIEADWPMA